MRISKYSGNTVGSLPCEVSLNKILGDLDDPHITRPVMRRYLEFKEGLREISNSNMSNKFKLRFLSIWKTNRQLEVEILKTPEFPRVVYTHLLCCMTAQYRISQRALK